MTLTLQAEPTDEEENQDHWLAFIEWLPPSMEKAALAVLWDQPPAIWAVLDSPDMLTIDIVISEATATGGTTTRLKAEMNSEGDIKRPRWGKGDGHWTLQDPTVMIDRNRAMALTLHGFRMVCNAEEIIAMARWMTLSRDDYIMILDHEHTWDCIHQIWIS